MRVDRHGKHAQRIVVFDEYHSSHIGRQIVDVSGAVGGPFAIFQEIQIQGKIFDIVKTLVPLIEGLAVHRANALVTARAEPRQDSRR